MKISLRQFLQTAAMSGVMMTPDRLLAAPAIRGRVTAGGRPLPGVVVSDGLACVETAADGTYEIPARDGVRFIFVTIPSGWRTSRRYHRFVPGASSYDFSLAPWKPSAEGRFSFMHIGDSEIRPERIAEEWRWVRRSKTFADERGCAFFVHTGDISYRGMKEHAELLNDDVVGRPVFYVLGNHDLGRKTPEGESRFEECFGPCWYSFDCGGVHFIVTPMTWGDGRPSYTASDVEAWLRNDLALAARKRQPVLHLVHGVNDNGVFDTRRLYGESRLWTTGREPFDVMAACDFRGIVHGHFHLNYFRRSNDRRIEVVSAAPPLRDFATLQVVHVGEDAKMTVENRYGIGDPWKAVAHRPKGELWHANAGGAVYYGAPCVAEGLAAVGTIDLEGRHPCGVYAYDAKTGAPRWTYQTESDVWTRLIGGRGRIFVQDGDWRISALDARTGKPLWKRDLRDTVGLAGAKLGGGTDTRLRNAMTLDWPTGRLYCGTARESLLALDPETGKTVWRTRDKGTHFLSSISCTAVCGDTVVGGIMWQGLYGYDAATGERLWCHEHNKSPDTQTWYRSGIPWIERIGFPVLRDGRLFIAAHSHFFEVEPRSGKMMRMRKLPFCVNCYHEPLLLGDKAYFGSWAKGLVCFDLTTFDVAWTAPVEDALVCPVHYAQAPMPMLSSSPRLWKGLVWATGQDGAVYAWDPQTGARKERIVTGMPYIASATVADDRLYVADFGGNLRCFA